MSGDIAVIESKLTLPTPKSPAAIFAAKRMDVAFSALGSVADRNMFASSAIMAINELPQGATEVSVMKAVIGAAYLQLPFGSTLGFAYMLPFRNRNLSDRGGKDVFDITLCIGYQGFLELGLRSNFLTDIHADVVCTDDEFKFWKDETGPRLMHVPQMDRNPGRPNVIGAYCLYHSAGGGHGLRFVTKNELTQVDKKKDVWNSNFPAMCMKTAVRRAAKEWRKTPQLAYAVEADEMSDRDEVANLPAHIVDSTVIDALQPDAPAWTPPTE